MNPFGRVSTGSRESGMLCYQCDPPPKGQSELVEDLIHLIPPQIPEPLTRFNNVNAARVLG
jgi:hypothetical protein